MKQNCNSLCMYIANNAWTNIIWILLNIILNKEITLNYINKNCRRKHTENTYKDINKWHDNKFKFTF